MSSRPRNEDASYLQEAAEEEEVLKLEEEVHQMAQKILEYRTTLPDQFSSTLGSILASRRPVLTIRLADEGTDTETQMLQPDSQAGASQGLTMENTDLLVTGDKEEAEKIQLLKQKICSNTAILPGVLNKMKEYMARIDKLESSNLIIHPAFKKKPTG